MKGVNLIRIHCWKGVSSSMIYLIYCKSFCKCHNVPLAQFKKQTNKNIVSTYVNAKMKLYRTNIC
jgi:galactose-1-phosphate uridylyltransferase